MQNYNLVWKRLTDWSYLVLMAGFEDASQLPVRRGDEGATTHQARAQYTNQTKRMTEWYNTEHHVHSVLPDQLRPLSETNVTIDLSDLGLGLAVDSEIRWGEINYVNFSTFFGGYFTSFQNTKSHGLIRSHLNPLKTYEFHISYFGFSPHLQKTQVLPVTDLWGGGVAGHAFPWT